MDKSDLHYGGGVRLELFVFNAKERKGMLLQPFTHKAFEIVLTMLMERRTIIYLCII